MKTVKWLQAALLTLLLGGIFQACTEKTSLGPESAGGGLNKAKVAALSIDQVTSSECTACVSGPYQQNYLGIDYAGSTLTVSGSGFGSTTGTVGLSTYGGGTSTTYSVTILSWSDNVVKLRGNSTLSAVPGALTLKLTTSAQEAFNYSFQNVPTVFGRVYAQPNWYTNLRRIQFNKLTQPRGSDNAYTSLLNGSYVPTVGDIWLFGSTKQQSIVTTVSYRTQTIGSGIYDEIYQVGTAETNPNGQSASASNFSREIVFRRSGSSRTLRTPASSAFNSAFTNVTTTADKYYR